MMSGDPSPAIPLEQPVELRQAHARLTRDRIMHALASIVASEGVHDFSVLQVAEEAGVSHRTVYRHYPSREQLLEALAGWLEVAFERSGGSTLPEHPEELPGLVARNFEALGEHAELVRALQALASGANLPSPSAEERLERFQQVIGGGLAGHLDEEAGRAAAGVVHVLSTSDTFRRLTEEEGLSTSAAGRAAEWALTVLLDDLRSGGGPSMEDEEGKRGS